MEYRVIDYRGVWETENSLPAPCSFCGIEVTAWGRGADDGVIHHVDEDRSNNALENLLLAHKACHTAHHGYGKWKSEETRQKMSESAKRRYEDPEQRAITAAALKGNKNGAGRKDSAETKEKRAAHHRGTKRTPEQIARMRMARWGR